jgi:glycosyltransferase involved in cell wall biosynthesis
MGQAREAGLADRISFPGNVMAMADLLGASDVFVMSSLWEGLPLVLLEAMAAGLPVVAPRIPGVVDVVTDGVEGILVEPRNPQAMAAAMVALVQDRHRADAMGQAARITVGRRFDFAATISQLHDLYEANARNGARSARPSGARTPNTPRRHS